jgi:hypothetical protein
MSILKIRYLTVVLALFCASPALCQQADYVRHFDYDKSASLELKTIGTETEETSPSTMSHTPARKAASFRRT